MLCAKAWRPPPRPTCAGLEVSVGGGDRPAEPGELARGGDSDDRAPLVTLFHPRPDVVQAPLGLPGKRDDLGFAVGLAAGETARDPGRSTVMPGRLDQEPAGVLAAGLGDRTAALALAGGMLGRDDAEVAHDLRRVPEAAEVANLGAQTGGGQGVDPAQAHQPARG